MCSHTPGDEPLNVIVSAQSNVSLGDILLSLEDWDEVPPGTSPPGCMSLETADVTGQGPVVQGRSWRLANVPFTSPCIGGNIRSLTGVENHARWWNQPVTGSTVGAWFAAASYETACVVAGPIRRTLLPSPSLPFVGPPLIAIATAFTTLLYQQAPVWHCINGGAGSFGSDGYNRGASDLASSIVSAAQSQGWQATVRTDPRPAGIGQNGVGYSDRVYVVTVKR